MSNAALKQEFFNVDLVREKLTLRPNRFTPNFDDCFLGYANKKYRVLNFSPFGLAVLIEPNAIVEFKNYFQDPTNTSIFQFQFQTQFTQDLSLRWVRYEKKSVDDTSYFLVGLEVTGEPLNTSALEASANAKNILDTQMNYTANLNKLPAGFKAFVYEMKDWLTNLKSLVDSLEKDTPIDSLIEAQEYRESIVKAIAPFLGKVIPTQYAQVPDMLKGLEPETLALAQKFARQQIGHLIYGSPFASRAYFKPRGYAGDYEMMNHLYRNELLGKTLYDQCVHKYFIDEPAGLAVKNRGHFLCDQIHQTISTHDKHSPIKIISIASGPANELQLFIQNSPPENIDMELTCLDQDEDSLKYAQKKLYTFKKKLSSKIQLRFINTAIKNIIARGLRNKDYDLIYSAGLFDYFSNPVAVKSAEKLLEAVKPGGRLIIGNFSKNNPSIPFMELVLDWHLIYRSEEDLLKLFEGLGSEVTIEKEPLGVNLFVIIKK